MCIKNYFFWLTALLCLGACDSSLSIFSKEELQFFQSKADSDRKPILTLSDQVYSGSPVCFIDSSCLKVCDKIYSLEDGQKECKQLKSQQVYQIEKLSDLLFEKKLSSLENINVFDLKVFFNVSSEPLLKFFKSLDLFSSKVFFSWIALNWQVAKVFHEEDSMFLFLRIFLNKLADSPINSLKEPMLKDRTFVELSWFRQNDFALLWLNDYFKKEECAGGQANELNNCVLAKYCLVSDNFKEDVSTEFIEFSFIRDLVKKEGSYTDFKNFCSDFCLSDKGKNYCV